MAAAEDLETAKQRQQELYRRLQETQTEKGQLQNYIREFAMRAEAIKKQALDEQHAALTKKMQQIEAHNITLTDSLNASSYDEKLIKAQFSDLSARVEGLSRRLDNSPHCKQVSAEDAHVAYDQPCLWMSRMTEFLYTPTIAVNSDGILPVNSVQPLSATSEAICVICLMKIHHWHATAC